MPDLYLLDTNIVSHAIRDIKSNCYRRIVQADPRTICTSILVSAELRFGILKRGASSLFSRVEDFLAKISIRPLDGDADRVYAAIRLELERLGQPIGGNDMLIAAHALALQAVLVTDNVSEFSRVPGLRVENWIARRQGA
jgi:tRNA(fMet)-specific endonuclease VapC